MIRGKGFVILEKFLTQFLNSTFGLFLQSKHEVELLHSAALNVTIAKFSLD